MIISEKERKEIIILGEKHPIVKRMYDEILSYASDPAKVFYQEMSLTIKTLSEELKTVREDEDPQLKIMGNKDLFTMIKDLLTNSEKIFAGLKKGKLDIDPNAKQQEDNKDKLAL